MRAAPTGSYQRTESDYLCSKSYVAAVKHKLASEDDILCTLRLTSRIEILTLNSEKNRDRPRRVQPPTRSKPRKEPYSYSSFLLLVKSISHSHLLPQLTPRFFDSGSIRNPYTRTSPVGNLELSNPPATMNLLKTVLTNEDNICCIGHGS